MSDGQHNGRTITDLEELVDQHKYLSRAERDARDVLAIAKASGGLVKVSEAHAFLCGAPPWEWDEEDDMEEARR